MGFVLHRRGQCGGTLLQQNQGFGRCCEAAEDIEFVVRCDRWCFDAGDGRWEVVDWKTGRKPAAHDPIARMQLDLYALACMDVWNKRREDLRLTYLYLLSEDED